MRQRVRIQPYLSRAEHRRLRAYAAARNLSESALVEAALVDYFEKDATQQPVVLRRLEALAQATGHLRRDVNMLSEALSVFARFTFLAMPDSGCRRAVSGEPAVRDVRQPGVPPTRDRCAGS